MATVVLESVSFAYDSEKVLKHIDLTLNDGELHTLLGSSGCGKTTLLRCVAGFITPDEGRILVDGKDVTSLAPEKRHMGVVFQNYALFPQMSVEANVSYGLRAAHVPKEERQRRVEECLELVDMQDFKSRNAMELSGGQQQRVALARVLAMEPAVLLLDEPLSNLDAELRLRMRGEIRRIQQHVGITCLFITHDRQEALSISDRISVMRDGVIEQTGTPREVYEHPETPFVASFVGMVSKIPLTDRNGEEKELVVRPEQLRLTASPTEASVLKGTVVACRYEGFASTYTVAADNCEDASAAAGEGASKPRSAPAPATTLTAIMLDDGAKAAFSVGDTVWVEVSS